MKKIIPLMMFILLLMSIFSDISAENNRENPSLYSFGEIIKKLPKMWLANPIEVMEMMKDYPDYECWRSYDIVGCRSVNNRYSSEMFVNFQFSSDDDYAEFTQAVFSAMVNGTEGVQTVIEAWSRQTFWVQNILKTRLHCISVRKTQ